jgi:hypothetical protein
MAAITAPTMPRAEARTPTRIVDRSGQAWGHADPAYLRRWIARRDALLETVAVALQRRGEAAAPAASARLAGPQR